MGQAGPEEYVWRWDSLVSGWRDKDEKPTKAKASRLEEKMERERERERQPLGGLGGLASANQQRDQV